MHGIEEGRIGSAELRPRETEDAEHLVGPAQFVRDDVPIPVAYVRDLLGLLQPLATFRQRSLGLDLLSTVRELGQNAANSSVVEQGLAGNAHVPGLAVTVAVDLQHVLAGALLAFQVLVKAQFDLGALPLVDDQLRRRVLADLRGLQSEDVQERIIRRLRCPVRPNDQQAARGRIEDLTEPGLALCDLAFCGDASRNVL